MTTPRRPCITHQTLTVDLVFATSAMTRAEVAIICTDCGHEVVRTQDVPVTYTYRQELAHGRR